MTQVDNLHMDSCVKLARPPNPKSFCGGTALALLAWHQPLRVRIPGTGNGLGWAYALWELGEDCLSFVLCAFRLFLRLLHIYRLLCWRSNIKQ